MKRRTVTIQSQSNLYERSFRQIPTNAIMYGFILLFTLLLLFPPAIEALAAPKKMKVPLPLVTVVAVAEQDVNPPNEYVGHVEAIQVVDLQARVTGFLEQVNFKEGSDVQAGDILYSIEQASYQARVDAAKARVTKTQATLTRTINYLKRIQNVRTGGVSATDIESAETDKLESRAELQEAMSALDLAELDLSYTRISAPISGRIGATSLTIGNLCEPTSGPLAKIVQLDPIRVQYSVSENDLSAIKMALTDSSSGQAKDLLRPQIKLPGGEILDLSGHVDFVDNVVDASTGTISVRLVFDNPDGMLLPGQYVTVLVSRKQARLKPVVPQAAVLEDRDGRSVLVVNAQNQVEQHRINTGPTIGTVWVVNSGLTTGEMVILQGLQKVKPGQSVRIMSNDESKGN